MPRQQRVEKLFLTTQTMIRSWKSYFYKVLEPENISPMQMAVLFHLGSNQPVTGRRLADALHMSPSAMAQIIEGLNTAGYVTRKSDYTDKRIKYFGLSRLGSEKLTSLEMKRRNFFAHVTATLSDQEIDTLINLHEKMSQQISGYQEEKGEKNC